jgi:hypothetical protein
MLSVSICRSDDECARLCTGGTSVSDTDLLHSAPLGSDSVICADPGPALILQVGFLI